MDDDETLYIIEKQSKIRDLLTEIFEKNDVQTRTQKKAKLEKAEALVKEFKANDAKILAMAKPDIPYVVNKSGEKNIKIFEENLEKLRNFVTKEMQVPEPIETSTASMIQSDQKIRLKKLEFKLANLMSSIEETQAEVLAESSIQREWFEFKNKILFEQWNSISSLEEEIVIYDNEESPTYERGTCREVYGLLNSCIKDMSSKISVTTQSLSPVQKRESKLPDLKVPIFKGDYKQWNNFKDVFESLIHSKESLSTIQKMEYLKTYLEGEPLRLISAFTLSADNYKDAYDVLKKRYENKRKLLTIHLDNMFKSLTKTPSAEAMKDFHDSLSDGMVAIRNMGVDNSSWGPLIVHLAISCLDIDSRSLYEQKYSEQPEEIPQLKEFLQFLENRYKTLEILDPLKNINSSTSSKAKINYHEEKKAKSNQEKKAVSCLKCDGEHRLFLCPRFLALSVKSRYKFVKGVKLCVNCLQKHPSNQQCETKRTCKHCQKFHNSLLHFDANKSSVDKHFTQSSASVQANLVGDSKREEILATATVVVRDRYGNPFSIRVLIDTGAQRNYVTEELVQNLRLPRQSCRTEVTGIGRVNAYQVKYAVELSIEPVFPSNFDIMIEALVMGKQLTSPIPDALLTERLPETWPELQLADPKFRIPGQIDMILGIAFFSRIILSEIYRCETSALIAMNSKLGWLILGESKCTKNSSNEIVKSMVAIDEVRDEISKYWELEDMPQHSPLSDEDQLCESIFLSTHRRQEDGRYVVNIPFTKDPSTLGSSRKRALCRFYSIENKFQRNPTYAKAYREFMAEYINLGHMEVTTDMPDDDSYYMPHHSVSKFVNTAVQPRAFDLSAETVPSRTVLKSDFASTKFRVVFDASAKTTNNVSLNSYMLPGPRLQDDLATIILRWRSHKYVISADAEKMYRQIKITPEHQRYQKVFWRDSPNDPLKVYQLTTVTYGTTSAPYLAVKVLQQLAIDEQDRYPIAAPIVLRDFYVDDVLTGADSLDDCKALQHQLKGLLQTGGFSLRKWCSNCSDVLSSLNPEDIKGGMLDIRDSEDPSIKTLGLIWNPKEDQFSFKVSVLNFDSIKMTKRALSSDISKVFDPLGWLSPITIVAKLLFQETWSASIDWNDELPPTLSQGWKKFRANLTELEQIKIPRWLSSSSHCAIEIHGFCDASESAYAAAVYVKCTLPSGDIIIRLLMAKTKVAPIKQKLTVAKLELCGAHLLSKVYKYVVHSYQWELKPFYAWCDSTITLAWIHGDITRWKIFVANRVSDIHQSSGKLTWRYVSTKDNPADCATRGLTASQLLQHSLWWEGPEWLKHDESYWPMMSLPIPEVPEVKKSFKALTVNHRTADGIESLISRFSSYDKMKTTIAYCFRFASKYKSKIKICGSLTTKELRNAEESILRQVQLFHYKEELTQLQKHQKLKNINGILSLCPILDEGGILRVTGRLQNAAISFNEKHPIILPRKSHISRLIVMHAHINCGHGLHSLTEYVVKRRFWIIRCKDLIKYVIRHCVTCNRKSPKLCQQRMGDLPPSRIDLVNPFYYTGVDYAGPFNVRPWKGRCTKVYKAYICVFVCMTVKALHLELVSDLTSEGFLAAYRRFSSRRGPCLHIYSDCGTNFVGADNIMASDFEKCQQQWTEQIKPLTVQGVTWHFNPPAAPHAGGLWEAAVKSVKGLLLKHLGNTTLTYEEFATVLTQVEGCLNSRPLGVLHNVPEDRVIITPNHFLTGSSVFSHPEPEAENISLQTRWKYVQVLRQQIFNEFKIQLLQKLQPRRRWPHESYNIQPNDLVVVEDHSCPSHKWPLGIIEDVHSGKDGLVRVVSVRMENGKCLKRPVTKVGLIPLLSNSPETIKSSEVKETEPLTNVSTEPQHSTQRGEVSLTKRKYNLRSCSKKSSAVTLWAAVLCLFMTEGQAIFNSTTVKQFEHQSGLFFAKVGDMKASTSSWSMVLYYNMTSFYNELKGLEDAAQLFESKCVQHVSVTSYCYATYQDMRQQLDEIIQDNNVLMDMNHIVEHPLQAVRYRRTVTSLLPFMGALSRAAFGTLDEEYARELEHTIASMQTDDTHLLNLIKNQTSVVETFLQQARLTEDRTSQQFQWLSSSLNVIEKAMHDDKIENTLLIRLQFIASHIAARTQHLFSIQSAMIQAVTNAHHGNLRSILNPKVFKNQLTMMKTSLSADLTIPVTSNNLIKLYSLISTETRVSRNMIIFKFTLPLISTKQFEIFKPIPLPYIFKEKLIIIQPSIEYLAVSLHRDKYIEMSSVELAECGHLDETTSLCAEHHPEFKNVPDIQSCEMKIFAHQQFDQHLCNSVMVATDQLWIQLPVTNQWVFYTNKAETYNSICDKDVRTIRLKGEGILTLNPKCALEHKTFTIPKSHTFESEVTQHMYFPELNISLQEPERLTTIYTNKSSIMLRRTDNMKDLQNQLTAIKVQQYLHTKPYVHRFSVGSFSIVIIFVTAFGCYQGWKWFRNRAKSAVERVMEMHELQHNNARADTPESEVQESQRDQALLHSTASLPTATPRVSRIADLLPPASMLH